MRNLPLGHLCFRRQQPCGWLFLWILGSIIGSCTVQQYGNPEAPAPARVNALILSENPYLQAHATTAIDWFPYDTLPSQTASSPPLVFIEIGTTTCYPCQQQQALYEHPPVQDLLARSYTCLKVDLIERPDLARRYSLLREGGQGGWPLHIIALPDGRPLRVQSLLTHEQLMAELGNWERLARERPQVLQQHAVRMDQQLAAALMPPQQLSVPADAGDLQRWQRELFSSLRAPSPPQNPLMQPPQFPYTMPYRALLDLPQQAPGRDLSGRYLYELSQGAIRDHLGGGFMRCSDDLLWRRPHFEKTLYDNALLLHLICEQQRRSPDQYWTDLIYETWEFLDRELKTDQGLYLAALRPDSEGELGRYYLWPEIDIRAVLKKDPTPFLRTYEISRAGNWGNGQNVLFRTRSDEELAQGYRLSTEAWQQQLNTLNEAMLAARNKRVPPQGDPQVVVGWQGLLISAALESYSVTRDGQWLQKARWLGEQLRQLAIRPDGSVAHILLQGQSSGSGFLQDYSYLLQAMTQLYQASLEPKWLESAERILSYLLVYHYEPTRGWFQAVPPDLRERHGWYDLQDEVLPASQAVLNRTLWQLSWTWDRPQLREICRRQLRMMYPHMSAAPLQHTSWLLAANEQVLPRPLVSLPASLPSAEFAGLLFEFGEEVWFRLQPGAEHTRQTGPAGFVVQQGLLEIKRFDQPQDLRLYLRSLR